MSRPIRIDYQQRRRASTLGDINYAGALIVMAFQDDDELELATVRWHGSLFATVQCKGHESTVRTMTLEPVTPRDVSNARMLARGVARYVRDHRTDEHPWEVRFIGEG